MPLEMPRLLEESRDRLTRMVALLGFDAKVDADDIEGTITLTLKTQDAGRLIGRKGHCLQSLELLLDRMLRKNHEDCPPLEVVIDGYRATHEHTRRGRRSNVDEERCRHMAEDTAKETLRWGEERLTPPLNAAERRIVHMTLRDDPDVETVSEETERDGKKRVIVRLAKRTDT